MTTASPAKLTTVANFPEHHMLENLAVRADGPVLVVALSIFPYRKNLQEPDRQVRLFPYIVRKIDPKTAETLGFCRMSAAIQSR